MVAGGAPTIREGDLLRGLRRFRWGTKKVQVVVVDGTDHLAIAPQQLARVARMMETVNKGYLVVIVGESSPLEGFEDMLVDWEE